MAAADTRREGHDVIRVIFAAIWSLSFAATIALAVQRLWVGAFASAVALIVAVVLWVGNELANRIEDHDHERRTY